MDFSVLSIIGLFVITVIVLAVILFAIGAIIEHGWPNLDSLFVGCVIVMISIALLFSYWAVMFNCYPEKFGFEKIEVTEDQNE